MRLQEWADANGISYMTAWRWHKAGKIDTRKVNGVVMVNDVDRVIALYVQVAKDQELSLATKVETMLKLVQAKKISVTKIVTEVGSEPDGHLRNFYQLLRDPKVSTIIVEHPKPEKITPGWWYLQGVLDATSRKFLYVDLKKQVVSSSY
jgi:predicted site-specific integrase-resolvase